jgi:hypothetical protein
LGVVLAGIWFKSGRHLPPFLLPRPGDTRISDETRDLLRRLNSQVEIRFYAVLPSGSAPEPLQDFSRRVDRLLSQFQSANDRRIQVIRKISASDANADAAAADGIRPFNLEKGEACFLGLTVVSGTRKESLPRLQPEWEPALPIDLARAILHVTAEAPPPVAVKSTPLTPALSNEIVRLIPDIKNTSPEDADRIFHEDFLAQCAKAGAELEAQVNAAQQEVARAENSGSPAELETAQKHLSQVQLGQTEKLREIAAHLQSQLAAFQQLQAAATNTGK